MGTNLVSACQKPLWQLPSSKGQHNKHKKVLPKVLLVGPPKNMGVLKPQSPQKYKLSKPWDGSLSLKEFMNENNYEGSMFEALICSVWDAPIDANVLQQLPCLKLVVTTTAGTDHIDIKECHRRGIQVANVGSLHTEDVADMAVALLFGVLTNIVRTRMRSSACNSPIPSTFKLGGKRVGIIGLGSIGIQVAKRLEAFGCNIAYHSRNKKPFISYPFYSNIVELATVSDALVLCCSLNEQTKHMVNKKVLLALGNKGVIVNVGRGSLIDEKELVKCLMEGQIGGAGLDVVENEPHVPQELLEMNNVVLSPHNASFTIENQMALTELVAENLEALFSNKPIITSVGLYIE